MKSQDLHPVTPLAAVWILFPLAAACHHHVAYRNGFPL
jgi:hypothetical protein